MSHVPFPPSSLVLPHNPALNDRVNTALATLRDQTFYLGDPDVYKKLTWCRAPEGRIVLEIPRQIERQDGDPPATPVDPKHAKLSAIVLLTYDDFHLSEDGYWETPTSSAPTLADVILSCTGGMPKHDTLCTDFINVINNIDALISESHKRRHLIQNIRPISTINLSPKVQFRHILFTVRHSSSTSVLLVISSPHP